MSTTRTSARAGGAGPNSWFDPYGQHPTTPLDLTGHGTATMGVMVGGDAGGTSIGMAPGATWIAARIFNDSGSGTATAIHAALQWVLDPDGNPATDDAPDVLNNSWAYGSLGCNLAFQLDLQALRATGILPVFAAGNFGPGTSTSVSPANYPESLAVGAVDNAGVDRRVLEPRPVRVRRGGRRRTRRSSRPASPSARPTCSACTRPRPAPRSRPPTSPAHWR